MPNRPLTPSSVGPILRVLLPAVTAFCGFIAWQWWTVSPEELASSIVLRTLDSSPSLRVWAAAVGIGALTMAFALIRHRRALYVYALAVATAPFVFMSLVSGVAAFHSSVSSSAWAWPALVVALNAACIRGLSTREG